MSSLVLKYDTDKISARLVKTEKKYAKYINNICEFKDLNYINDLFIIMGGESLDFGSIEYTETYFKEGKEFWEITTSKSYFKFQILKKPQLTEPPIIKHKEIVDELKAKRTYKEIHKLADKFLNEEPDFSLMTPPWKI